MSMISPAVPGGADDIGGAVDLFQCADFDVSDIRRV
jgi:hypothetical protein